MLHIMNKSNRARCIDIQRAQSFYVNPKFVYHVYNFAVLGVTL